MVLSNLRKNITKSQMILNLIEDNCHFGIIETDKNGIIEATNEELNEIFRINSDIIVGKYLDELSYLFGVNWENIAEYHFSQMLQGHSGEFETSIRMSDNIDKYIRVAYYPIFDNDFLGTVVMVFDETSKKKVLADLIEFKGEF